MGLTREKAKELLPIINGFVDGGMLQFKDLTGEWYNTNYIDVEATDVEYRIKPEPKYRPFKTQEECWKEMHKHPDFGWVKRQFKNELIQINRIVKSHCGEYIVTIGTDDFYNLTLQDIFTNYTFTDGEPFGVKEE